MQKTFVLDTNVLLHNADSIKSFDDNVVVLPMTVIEELDRFKTRNDELGRNARKVIRNLDILREVGNFRKGVPMENKGTLKIIMEDCALSPLALDPHMPDNKIISVALTLLKEGEKVIFVSKDINARIKADALGLEVKDFEKQKVNFDELFSGFREIMVTEDEITEFHQKTLYEVEGLHCFPNEFVLLKDKFNPKHTAMGRAANNNMLLHLNQGFENAWNIKPRNREQRIAMELLMEPSLQVVTLVGQAGTGKTLLALAAGLETVERQNQYDKILVSRPIIPMGKDIGYLPGDKEEKLINWMQPIFDNLTFLMSHNKKGAKDSQKIQSRIDKLFSTHVMELEALTYIRGRSIPKQFVIVDEAQNLTPHEIKTIISRAGEGTKMVITGDPYQIDNPYLDSSSNGLTYAVERLKEHSIHGHISLMKSERSALSALAANLL